MRQVIDGKSDEKGVEKSDEKVMKKVMKREMKKVMNLKWWNYSDEMKDKKVDKKSW